jgi:DNA helicase-2/ATP-dependent DNA helicase PcrA
VKGVGPVALEHLAARGPMLAAARRGVLPPRYHPAIARIVATVDGLRTKSGSLDELVTSVWRTLGYGTDAEGVEGELLATLLDLAREASTLDALVDAVVVLDEPEAEPPRDAVTLLTLHAAKGLEFSLVCIAGMEEGLLPHRRALDEDRELAEERRLCYVGMTRAKDRLVLSYADARLALAGLSLGAPSRFLDDVPPELVVARRTKDAERKTTGELAVAVGDRVRHRRWGEGRVERIETVDGGRYVTIRFADRTRRIRREYAPLEAVR